MIINSYVFASPYDPDAQAFISAASITDTTQQVAINNLVLNLKSYNLWTKLKAVYPMVGGTAGSHKWNLKNPLDTNAAFRLIFTGGWTHSSTGALPNGTNAFANTYLDSQTYLSLNSGHFSFYSRTNAPTASIRIDMGALKSAPDSYSDLNSSNQSSTYFRFNNGVAYDSLSTSDSLGFYSGSRTASNVIKTFKNGGLVLSGSATSSATSTTPIYIGAANTNSGAQYYANRECAFASIGDGLTDAEMLNLYIAVETYQTALGRNIGVPIVSDSNAQAFLCAANITNSTQASAVNQLVIDMKAANIWTKMKAVYPFVGGTATTHKWNLKDPRDLNAAFRLQFNGGWTHSSTGATPNGSNGWANTYMSPNTSLSLNSTHISYYSRTNVNLTQVEIGSQSGTAYTMIEARTANTSYFLVNTNTITGVSDTNSSAFYIGNRTASNVTNGFRNNSKIFNSTVASNALTINNIYIGALNNLNNVAQYYSTKECAFSSIGDGLIDTEAANLYTAVQNFNTTLGRNNP